MRKWCSCAAKKIVVRPRPSVHRKVPAGEFPVQPTIEPADRAAHPFTSKLTELMNCTLPPAFSTSITTATWTFSAASLSFLRQARLFRNSGDEFVLAVFRLKRALWPWRSPVVGGVVGSLIFVHAIVGLVQQRLHDAAFIIGGDRPTVGVAERKLIAVTVCSVGSLRRLSSMPPPPAGPYGK